MAQIPEAPIPSASSPTPPSGGSSQAPWIIAGAIVLAALLVVIALVMLNKDSGNQVPVETPTEAPATPTPSPTVTKPPHTRSPRPSPSSVPSPSPSPSPTVDESALVREAAEKSADADRPGEVKHVGNVSFFKDSACATREGAGATVRYTTSPKAASFLLCKNTQGKWKVTQGPIYGE